MPTPRPCIVQGCSSLARGKPRCPAHEKEHQARRNQVRPHYQGEWPALAKATVQAHILKFGYVCPGWGDTPSHPATDLCCDHITARDPSHLQVLCRSCNSRKSATER